MYTKLNYSDHSLCIDNIKKDRFGEFEMLSHALF